MISAQPLDGAGNHASDERSTDSREREREKVSLDIYYMNHMLILFILYYSLCTVHSWCTIFIVRYLSHDIYRKYDWHRDTEDTEMRCS